LAASPSSARTCCRLRRRSVFVALLRRPLRARLFPYTTLFRSAGLAPRGPRRTGGVGGRAGRAGRGRARRRRRARRVGAVTATTRDRKSTRLNSSHVKISYAVFCLKKKNKRRSQHATSPIQSEH